MSINQTLEVSSSKHEEVRQESSSQQQPLYKYVESMLNNYFSQLGDTSPNNIYEMVLAEVEIPTLKAVMRRTRNNQSKAAIMLGLSRGTLRKKLKIYGMDNSVDSALKNQAFNSESSFSTSNLSQHQSFQKYVEEMLENYFTQLGDTSTNNLYEMVLAEVEVPMLKTVMRHTRNNQSKTAIMMGLSRGTLRKKLKIYGLDN